MYYHFVYATRVEKFIYIYILKTNIILNFRTVLVNGRKTAVRNNHLNHGGVRLELHENLVTLAI